MTALEVLCAARGLLARSSAWSQIGPRNQRGELVHCSDPRAVAFDVYSALARVGGPARDAIHEARDVLCTLSSAGMLIAWNDEPERTHWDILQLLDAGILELERRAA